MEDKVELKLIVNKDDLFKACDQINKKFNLVVKQTDSPTLADAITVAISAGSPEWTQIDLANGCFQKSAIGLLEELIHVQIFKYGGITRKDFDRFFNSDEDGNPMDSQR